MTINIIYDVLKMKSQQKKNGLDEWELGYYESILADKEYNHQEQDNENYFEKINDYLDNSMEI